MRRIAAGLVIGMALAATPLMAQQPVGSGQTTSAPPAGSGTVGVAVVVVSPLAPDTVRTRLMARVDTLQALAPSGRSSARGPARLVLGWPGT
jgi:hypothetical protein